VAERVVDVLQVVDVEDQDGALLPRLPHALDMVGEHVLEGAPV